MKLWGSVKDMPELAGLPENEKLNIVSDSSMRIYRHWQVWAGWIGLLLLSSLGGSIGGAIGGAIAGGIGGGCFLAPIVLRTQAAEIRKLVAERKHTTAV